MAAIHRCLWGHWCSLEDRAAQRLQFANGQSVGAIDVDTRCRLDLDAAEEGGEEELIAIEVEQRKSAIALFETAEFGSIDSKRRSSVIVVMTVTRATDSEADEDEVGVFGGQVEVELLVEDGVKAIFLDNLCSTSMWSSQARRAIATRCIEAALANNTLHLFLLIIGMIDLNFDVWIDSSVGR